MDRSAQDRKLRQTLAVFFGSEYDKQSETSKEAEKFLMSIACDTGISRADPVKEKRNGKGFCLMYP